MEPLFSCSVKSGNVWVNFHSEMDLYPLFTTKNYTRFFPEFDCQRGVCDSPASVIYSKGEERILKFKKNRVVIRFPWKMMRKGETLLYLSYPLLEYQRQKQGELTSHAAAFSMYGMGFIILGKEGAGKSLSLIELCRKENGKLIANDLCLIGGNKNQFKLNGGTKFLFLRLESVRRNMPDLESLFDLNIASDSWLNKIIIEPQELGIEIEEEKSIPLIGAFLIHIDERQNVLFTKRVNDLVTTLYLNENFSRYIRSTCTTMLGCSGPLSSDSFLKRNQGRPTFKPLAN